MQIDKLHKETPNNNINISSFSMKYLKGQSKGCISTADRTCWGGGRVRGIETKLFYLPIFEALLVSPPSYGKFCISANVPHTKW